MLPNACRTVCFLYVSIFCEASLSTPSRECYPQQLGFFSLHSGVFHCNSPLKALGCSSEWQSPPWQSEIPTGTSNGCQNQANFRSVSSCLENSGQMRQEAETFSVEGGKRPQDATFITITLLLPLSGSWNPGNRRAGGSFQPGLCATWCHRDL